MNQSFRNFLKNRPENNVVCNHDKEHWCQNCIATPTPVSQELPDGTISKGYLITNL